MASGRVNVDEVEKYWEVKLGAGESILAINDYIEYWISYPSKEDVPSYNPIQECKVFMKQYDDPLMDDVASVEFPARKLRKLKKVLGKALKAKPCQKYEIEPGMTFTVKGRNKYEFETYSAVIFVKDFEEFTEIINDLILLFDEQCEKFP